MKIAFLGDSITSGCGATNIGDRYVDHVEKILNAEVLNYGVSGTRLARQKEVSSDPSTDYDFLARAENMDKDVDAVLVFGGTNDYGSGKAPFGQLVDQTPYTFCGAVNSLIEYLSLEYGQGKIGVILPLPRYNGNCKNESNNLTLFDYVKTIKLLAEKHGVKVLDLYTDGLSEPLTDKGDEFTVDGLHPNDNGHRILGEKISEFIKNNRW